MIINNTNEIKKKKLKNQINLYKIIINIYCNYKKIKRNRVKYIISRYNCIIK